MPWCRGPLHEARRRSALAMSDRRSGRGRGRLRLSPLGACWFRPDDRRFRRAVRRRDVEVEVEREGDGFRLAWSTLIYDDAGTPRRRDNLLHFLAAVKPGQFRTAETLEPFSGRPTAWAYVAGNALTVDVVAILPDG